MIVLRIFKFFVFLLFWLVCASCAPNTYDPSENVQINETDELKNDQNIYIAWNQGTVRPGDSDDDYGIGGTGISDDDYGIGGTGIIGTISGFGSIIVNGLHIEYTPGQKLDSPLGDKTVASLSVGHVVAVEAETLNGKLVAKKIIQQIALAGIVEEIDIFNRSIKVAGENVSILADENSSSLSIKDIAIGSRLTISGIRDTDTLYATNISKQRGQPLSLVSGNVTAVKTGQIEVDNRHTFNVPKEMLSDVKIGDFVKLDKTFVKTKDKTEKLSLKRIYGPMFDGRVERTSIEGFFSSRNVLERPRNIFWKSHLKRQVIFKVKGPDNKPIMIGAVQLDRERRKKLDFKRHSKVIQDRTNTNKLEEIDLSPKQQKKTKSYQRQSNKKSIRP